MGKIDKDIALAMMLSGESDSKIGEHFGTSRQAVNLLRKAFTRDGNLSNVKQSDRPVDETPVVSSRVRETQPVSSPQQAAPAYPTFEQMTDWMIRIIKDAGDTAQLRSEYVAAMAKVEELQNTTKNLQEELKQVTAQLTAFTENTRRYEAVIRQLGLPPPGEVES